MELDDMKLAWQTLDRRLETQAALNLHMFKESRLDKARRDLRPMVWWLRVQLLFGVAMIAFGAPIWSSHLHQPIVLISGIAMHLYGIAVIIVSGRLLWMIHNVDYSAPVLAIQQQLAVVRHFHLRSNLWLGLVWWFLWMPAMVVGWMWGGLPVQFVERAMPVYVWGTVIGIFGLALMVWLDRLMTQRPQLAARWNYNFPKSLERAQRVLDEISRFEKA